MSTSTGFDWERIRKTYPDSICYTVDDHGQQMLHTAAPNKTAAGTYVCAGGRSVALGLLSVRPDGLNIVWKPGSEPNYQPVVLPPPRVESEADQFMQIQASMAAKDGQAMPGNWSAVTMPPAERAVKPGDMPDSPTLNLLRRDVVTPPNVQPTPEPPPLVQPLQVSPIKGALAEIVASLEKLEQQTRMLRPADDLAYNVARAKELVKSL